jgi:hypothetical protein
MARAFACPECGASITLTSLGAGRQARCGVCGTWVEVPFFPRAGRSHRRRRRWWAWAGFGTALVGVVLAVVGITRFIQGRDRDALRARLGELTASADAFEQAGRFGDAFRELDAALRLARAHRDACAEQMDHLGRRRDMLAHRDAEALLAGAATAEPAQAVATCEELLDRCAADPALADLDGRVRDQLRRARIRQAETDLAAARQALANGQPRQAVDRAAQVLQTARGLPPGPSQRFTAEAHALAERVARRRGVLLVFPGGRNPLTDRLDPLLTNALHERGYVSLPARSPFHSLWEEQAPYRLTVAITETLEGFYLQSQNRTSRIDAELTLTEGTIRRWSAHLMGRTRVPLLDLPAFEAGRLAVGSRRDPAIERRFRDDAEAALLAVLDAKLAGLPVCPARTEP